MDIDEPQGILRPGADNENKGLWLRLAVVGVFLAVLDCDTGLRKGVVTAEAWNPGQAGPVIKQLPASNEPCSVQPQNKRLEIAPRGFLSTVEQRTLDWKKLVIASTVNTSGSTFGEHIVRPR